MFWIYILQAIICYYLLIKISKDVLNPFAISAVIWFAGAALSQLRLSELISEWAIETHVVVHIFAYTVIMCGLIFSRGQYEFDSKDLTFVFGIRYKYISRFFLGVVFLCAFLEWTVNGYYLPILSSNGGDLKSEVISISGIHYGTVCFPYFSLVALFELLFDENIRRCDKIYNYTVIFLSLFHTLFIQMSRGDLLIIILGMLLLVHAKHRIRFKYLIISGMGIVFSLLFFMMIRVQNINSLVYTAVEGNPYVSAIYMYIATCFDNLNSLVEHGSPYTLIYITILKPIFEVVDFTVSIPYLEYNVEFFNAKTMIYGFYHDLGIVGVVLYSFCIYVVVGVIYKKTKYDKRYLLLLAVLQKSIYVPFFGNYFIGTVCTTFPFFVVWSLCMSMDKKKKIDIDRKKKKNNTIIIVFEGIVREYDNALLLKSEFERRGYRVTLVAKYYPLFRRVKNAVILLPNCYNTENYDSYAYYLNSNGNIFISLQYEQVLSKRIEKIGIHNPKGKAKNIFLFCWGENCYRRLLNSGIDMNHLYISGAIQLDFLRPEFNDYYLTRKDVAKRYDLDDEKKWLLYISSFSFVDNSIIDKYTAHEFNDHEFIEKFTKVSIMSQKKTLEWFENLITENEEIIIIYRKHPMESKSNLLKRVVEKFPDRFRDISELSVKQWIKVSDIITTWFSTSIAEIYMAKKPMFLIRPYLIEEEYDVPFYYNAKCIDTYEKLNSILSTSNEKEILPIPVSSIEKYYSIEEEPSYKRIVNKVEEILKSNELFLIKERFFIIRRWKFLLAQNRMLKYFIKRIYQILYYYFHFEIKNEKLRKEFAVSDWELNIRNEKDIFNKNKYMKLKKIVNKENEE